MDSFVESHGKQLLSRPIPFGPKIGDVQIMIGQQVLDSAKTSFIANPESPRPHIF